MVSETVAFVKPSIKKSVFSGNNVCNKINYNTPWKQRLQQQ